MRWTFLILSAIILLSVIAGFNQGLWAVWNYGGGSNAGVVVGIPESTYIGIEVFPDIGTFWCIGGTVGDCPD